VRKGAVNIPKRRRPAKETHQAKQRSAGDSDFQFAPRLPILHGPAAFLVFAERVANGSIRRSIHLWFIRLARQQRIQSCEFRKSGQYSVRFHEIRDFFGIQPY